MSPVTYEWVMSHVNESCHMWMSHVTYEWVMPHTNESCHIGMSHVTYEWIMSHVNELCHIWMRHVTHEHVMSHMMSHTNESCHLWISHVMYEWVMLHSRHIWHESCHVWMRHVTYECIMSHMNESYHIWTRHFTYECTMSHHGMRHITPCHTHRWRISHMIICMICDMNHSYATRLIHLWHGSFICDKSLSYVWHDSFTPDMTFMCGMPHSYVTCLVHMRHDSFICDTTHSCMTWLIHVCLIHVCSCVTWRIHLLSVFSIANTDLYSSVFSIEYFSFSLSLSLSLSLSRFLSAILNTDNCIYYLYSVLNIVYVICIQYWIYIYVKAEKQRDQKHHIYRLNICVTHTYEWGHDTFACYLYDIFGMFYSHVWMRHATHEGVLPHMYIVTYVWYIHITHESCTYIHMCTCTHERVLSRMRLA